VIPAFLEFRVLNLDHIQWPAMATTLLAGWLVASKHRRRRDQGFWLFLVSNVLWVAWGASAQAYALIVLQFGLAISNIRGVLKNRASGNPGG
jgi:hypothetical protein